MQQKRFTITSGFSLRKLSLSKPDLELYRRIDEILHFNWDPTGVADVPETRSEYYSYLPQVFFS